MIKKAKIIGGILIAACAFGLASCGSSSTDNDSKTVVNTTDKINEKIVEKQKYVIELNVNNYQKYFDISTNTAYSQTSYTINGCLNYAFYDDVVFTLTYEENSTTKTQTYNANVAGNVFISGGGKYNSSITNVSGKVIYWI